MAPRAEDIIPEFKVTNGFYYEDELVNSSTKTEAELPSSNQATAIGQNGHHTRGNQLVAICGMAMRLPGGIHNGEAFWDVLVNGKDTRGPIPIDRYNAAGFSDRIGKKGAIKTQWGYFLSDDITTLDTSFFTLTKTELERTDPQQRQLLEVAREVLENAGEVGYRGKPIGCYVGTFGEDWIHMSSKETQHAGGYIMTGYGDLMLANRVSFEYDLKGPSIVIKTGCSASLIALHEACRALQFGDCKGAIVAGSNLIMGPTTTASMTQEGILSPEGSCKTFDAAADGFARAEAITAVYIKLLDDAIRDKNPIRAIIRNSGTNSDGKSQGLMTPNSKSHEAMMRKVYADIGLNPALTAFVECHGTGTATGDPLEATAVGEVFGPAGVYIGSVKPNVGHSEGASGITSIIKATLALEHEIIPPNIKFNTPNPKIPFTEKSLIVPVKPTTWPSDRAKRISINSFGIGGSNAHVILEAAPKHFSPKSTIGTGREHNAVVTLISANSQESARKFSNSIHTYATEHPLNISDMAYTLALHREPLPYRAYMISDGTPGHEISSVAKVPRDTPHVVMIFSGQGAQWPEMGRELLQSDAQFLKDIDEMNLILQSLEYPPSWNIVAELQKPPETSQVHRAELTQPLTTALQIAMINRLRRVGVIPNAVIGHSSGEIAAAYASGSLSMIEAIITAYYRGYVTKQQTLLGGMAAVGLGVSEASKYLLDGVVIACDNSPNSVTLSGDVQPLHAVLEMVKKGKPDVLARPLKVDMAYHSYHMTSLGQTYRKLLDRELKRRGVVRRNPVVRFVSSVTEELIQDGELLGPAHWEDNLTSPVRFNSAVQLLLQIQSNNLFLEIGPHSALAGPLREICATKGLECNYIPTMLRDKDCEKSALSALGQLYQQGAPINFEALYPAGKPLVNLPTYAWDHNDSFWYESRVSKEWRMRSVGYHSLLGLRVPECTDYEIIWRNMLSLEEQPWIADHKIVKDIVFPFAGYLAMVGEAIRQATGIDGGFRIRHAIAQSALVLTDNKIVEMVTTLRPLKLNYADESAWFEFTISSYSGSTWIKNCQGQVKAFTEDQSQCLRPEHKLQRHVDSSRWYQTMSDIGIVYGPEFQGLSNILCSTTQNLAAANICNPQHESPEYLFHPTGIDACLQLLLVALAKGISHNFGDLCVPTTIEDLIISPSAQEMHAVAWSNGLQDMAVDCSVDGKPVLRLRGLQLTPMDSGSTSTTDIHAAARLEWSPDFDLIDHSALFSATPSIIEETRMQEEMTLLCMLEVADRVRELIPCQPHFSKFRDWLEMENKRAAEGTYPLLGNSAKKLVEMTSSDRIKMIGELYDQLLGMSAKGAVVIGIKRIFDNYVKIFTGESDTLDILMQDDVLTHIYNAVSFGKGEFFRLLCHSRPTLRILEVGAGTGGTTETILRELVRPDGNSSYSLYTFTDISAGFFPQAKERFSYAPNMDYRVFDISQSPFNQGFEAKSYDVILAPNVIHATPSLKETLGNLQPLLRPGGYLVLTELCAVVRTPNFIFGNFSGWWLGESDGRPHEPYVSVDRWDRELKQAGLSGVDTAVYDAEAPYHYCAAIVSQRPLSTKKSASDQPVTILCENLGQGIAQRLIIDLQAANMTFSTCNLEELPASDQAIISLLDLEGYFFENITADRLAALQKILNHIDNNIPIIWLLRPTQVKCADPHSAHAIGIARSIRAESPIPFYTLEVDENETEFSIHVLRVWEKILNTEDNEILSPDKEYVVDEGVVKIGRYQPFSVEKELSKYADAQSEASIYSLEVATVGQLDTLQWVKEPISSLPRGDEVVIDVHAIGLNFRDIIYAIGVLKAPKDAVPIGLEIAGTVCQIGGNVRNVSIGDRVLAMPPSPCAKSAVTVPHTLVEPIPENMTFVDAATMPICYSTVIESLINIGQLEKGQSVLIHSATGGVGHAAIQICEIIGAEVYATVGNEEKIEYLMEIFGIPRNHIFNSRNDSFVADLMRETKNQGVDLVLNSLSGELLHASWDCVAEFGKLIELGKRDAAYFGKLEMHPFLKNRSYCCVDMTHLAQKRPKRVGAILHQMIQLYSNGQIKPLRPRTVFPVSQAQDAFRHLQNSDHIGKVVLETSSNFSALPSSPRPVSLQLDSEASYLITGGLGGLGRVISTWLVERGARSLVLLSRSAGSANNQQFLQELKSCGCSVTVIPGKVESKEDIQAAILNAPRPIKGIIHLAMVLQDSPFVSMPHSSWVTANKPKVTGAWNLHESFKDQHSLDFFVLASSLVTVVEQPGQGNYSAANTYLEAFCQYRQSLSLPASVLNICPIDGVGFVAENSFAKKSMKAQGLYFLGAKELLDFLELSILVSKPWELIPPGSGKEGWKNLGQIAMGLRSKGDLNDPNTRTNWRRDRRMGFYHNSTGKVETDRGSSNELKEFLSVAAEDPDILVRSEITEYLATEIGKKVYAFMLKSEDDLDIKLSLTQIGLDSLMAIELRRWWKLAFGLQISVLEIMSAGTLTALGTLAAQNLRTKFLNQVV